MTEYILSIISVILLTGAAGIVLPEGKTGKFVKSIFSVATLVVILTPLIRMKDSSAPVFDDDFVFEYDENYLEFIDYKESEYRSGVIEEMLEENGYETLVQLYYERAENQFKITKVLIFLKNSGISEQDEHIYISSDMIQAVAEYCGVGTDKVIVKNETDSKA